MKSRNRKGPIKAIQNALNGIIYVFKSQPNIKIYLICSAISIVLMVSFELKKYEVYLLILCNFLIYILELVNTANEMIVDLLVKNKSQRAKYIKDISAGFVLLMVVFSLVISYLIFFPRFVNLIL